jgi:hypothetical protein
VREIRTLRAMWRALETELRQFLYGHEEGNLGYKPRRSLRAPRQCSTLPAVDANRAFHCELSSVTVSSEGHRQRAEE